ncbi:hypothetical protein LOK49_LG08G02931 [Camellia lanceoleosa]|uniref:Uncharacterized protein n=1 Tax=Camellia lanceoleosa TaxID=1840588 RepID=A0ACC0GTE4_9ERIC|nr:hypothetical protein LOK49_LG08G02931 [Camellia lanceoleosa]
MLTAIHKGSVEQARASHIYSHRHGFRGFAAKIDQASQLAGWQAGAGNVQVQAPSPVQAQDAKKKGSFHCRHGMAYLSNKDQYPSSSSGSNGGQIGATTGGNHLSLSMSNSQQRPFINPPPLFATAAASSGFPQQVTT